MARRSGFLGVPRGERLRQRDAFQAVFQRGRRVERPSLIVLWRRWSGTRQVGFAVSRHMRGAVRRNRARRRLREAYRVCRQGLPESVQLVCVAREAAAHESFGVLLRDMQAALDVIARQCRAPARA